jgi:hypothetical protein
MSVNDHLAMLRRTPGEGTPGGRPPRLDEDWGPTDDELASAGWKRPARKKRTPARESMDESVAAVTQHGLVQKLRDLNQARESLTIVHRGGNVPGEPRGVSMARLPSVIVHLEQQVAEARAATERDEAARRAGVKPTPPEAA